MKIRIKILSHCFVYVSFVKDNCFVYMYINHNVKSLVIISFFSKFYLIYKT